MKESDEFEKLSFELNKKPQVSIDSLPPLTDFPSLLAGLDTIRTWIIFHIKILSYIDIGTP